MPDLARDHDSERGGVVGVVAVPPGVRCEVLLIVGGAEGGGGSGQLGGVDQGVVHAEVVLALDVARGEGEPAGGVQGVDLVVRQPGRAQQAVQAVQPSAQCPNIIAAHINWPCSAVLLAALNSTQHMAVLQALQAVRADEPEQCMFQSKASRLATVQRKQYNTHDSGSMRKELFQCRYASRVTGYVNW